MTFALDGAVELPKQPPPHFAEPIFEAGFEINEQLAAQGETLYLQKGCYACHGVEVVAGGMAPDLRASAILLSEMEPYFKSVVRDGERTPRGMPGFPDIKDSELEALRHYIRRRAHSSGAAP